MHTTRVRIAVLATMALAASWGCGGGGSSKGLNQTSVTCPAGRTLLDGVCVSEPVADYVACVRAQGATLGGSKHEQISADVGAAGMRAAGAAEVSENLEKKYATSDVAMLEIVRKCSASVTPTARTSPPEEPVADVDLTTVPRTSAKVGWGVLYVNQNHEAGPLVVAGQKMATGFFAHAESELAFDLTGGAGRFTSTVGLADSANPCYTPGNQYPGDGAIFVVEVDGAERYRSPTMRPGEIQRVSVELSGAKRLVLRTLTAGNGYCDHTVWGVPRLKGKGPTDAAH